MTHPLQPLFEPRSVAIIGASTNPEKRGHQVVVALQSSGFEGKIYPVNPRGGELLGLPVVTSIEALPEAPDLAYVATPAHTVPDVVAECGRRGIRGAIIPAVGFRESGEEGRNLEDRLLTAARQTGIRVIGPNTSGVLNTHARLHMVGGEPLAPGGLAILAQSGNVALDLMTAAAARPVGVSLYVGPGNETDVAFHEVLDYLGAHEPTRAIAIYLEGVKQWRPLFDTARTVARAKPIVVLKGGRSPAGGKAARSHTGAIAGSYEVFRALARQAGMIEVDRADELLPVTETLATQPVMARQGVVVLSDGGGHATLAADHLTAAKVPLATLSDETTSALRDLLGPAASVMNPVDAAGAADRAPLVLGEALRILSADPECGALLVTGLFGGYSIRFAAELAEEELAAADVVAGVVGDAGVPLVVHSLYAGRTPPPLGRLLELGIPVFGSQETAIRCVRALHERGVSLSAGSPGKVADARSGGRAPAAPGGATPAQGATGPPPGTEAQTATEPRTGVGPWTGAEVEQDPARWLSELETRDLLAPYAIELVPATFCRDEAEARKAACATSSALKLVSAHLPHKTEAGAVRLGLEGPDALGRAFAEAVESAGAFLAERGLPAEIDGALVSPMQPEPIAELLIGARRDPQFGCVLTVAIGGTTVELYRDVAIRALPVTAAEVENMCRELRLAPLLLGYRGGPCADLVALGRVGEALGACLLSDPRLSEIELNPVFAYEDRAIAIDVAALICEPDSVSRD